MKHPFKIDRNGRTYHLVKHPGARKLPLAEQARQPWYIRLRLAEGKTTWKKVGEADQVQAAVAFASELITKARAGGHPFTQLMEATLYRQTLCVGVLASRWLADGYALPNGKPRQGNALAAQRECLERALKWWSDQPVKRVTQRIMQDYMAWRRQNVVRGTGERAVDLELTTLSNMCTWAVARGDLDVNPFAQRPRFRAAADVEHCPNFAPTNDDELHQIVRWLFSQADPLHVMAGGQLMFMALTGLRPGEPGFLGRGVDRGPGARYKTTIDGEERHFMAVHRLKNGINPAVRVRGPLVEFLTAWHQWLAIHYPHAEHMFPHPTVPDRPLQLPRDPSSPLKRALLAAAAALGLPQRRPHAMRAYYVRVRRSQGIDDSTIAAELGERTGAPIIINTYGDPQEIFGTGKFDWLPDDPDLAPAWLGLQMTRDNIVPLNL